MTIVKRPMCLTFLKIFDKYEKNNVYLGPNFEYQKEMLLRGFGVHHAGKLPQYKKLVEMDDVELEVEEEAIREIAKKAMALKTGARGLRTIFESIMLDTMYELPEDDSVEKIIIDKDVVNGLKKPRIIKKEIA